MLSLGGDFWLAYLGDDALRFGRDFFFGFDFERDGVTLSCKADTFAVTVVAFVLVASGRVAAAVLGAVAVGVADAGG